MSNVTQVIREHHDEIIRLWLDNAGRLLSAEGLAPVEVISNVPELLSMLADVATKGAPEGFAGSARKLIESHVSSRLRHGFDIEDVVAEFSLLGRCIVDTWGQRHPIDPPSGDDVQRICSHVSGASVYATELFRSHMMVEEQAEKRVMRQLSGIAEDALHNEHLLRDRLEDVVGLVMRAMNATSASLVVYDAQTIVASAVVGTGRDALARFALSSSSDTLPSSSSRRARAEASETHVSEELAAHGIRALLTLRATRHSVGTVISVGMSRAHAFTSRETRRLEALGEWVTILLDNATLHARLADRVAALSGETDVRDRLMALIAHDLRGPLSAAKLCAELLARKGQRARERSGGKPAGDASDELASKIVRLLVRCDGMVSNLLDANRLYAGESLHLDLAPCDLQAICDGVVDELGPALGDRLVRSLSSVTGNWSASELHRAVWNLVSNAIKYGEKGATITIATRATSDGAELSVHNFGAPIDANDLPNIFRPFARAANASARGFAGWGLGLALVKACADAHGGDVRVVSDGSGTTFTLRLPRDAKVAQTAVGAHAVHDASAVH